MSIKNKTVVEQLTNMEQEAQAEDAALWGGVQGNFAAQSDLINSPTFREIIGILHQNPLLVAPVLKWLKLKRAAMAKAQLDVLYSPEELAEMMKSVQ